MSREPGDQPTRRTVAELLEQHGAKPASSPRRHRRRATEDDGENELTTTAPQAIIDRINSEADSGSAPTRRNGSPHSHAVSDEPPAPPHAAQPQAPQAPPPVRPAPQQPPRPPGQPPQSPGSGYQRAMPPPSSPSWPAMPPQEQQPPEPPHPPQQQAPQQQQSLGARLEGFAASRQQPPVEDSTEQMPAVGAPGDDVYGYAEDYEDDYQGGYYQDFEDEYEYDEDYQQGYPPGHPGAAYQADPYGFVEDYDYEDDYPPGYDPDYEGDVDGPPIPGAPDERAPTGVMAPVGTPDARADAERFDADVEPTAHGKEWLAVAAQLTLGVVGGAAVWLLFNWLWMQIPALALVAALAVVVGLVWIVRKIRKAEDMQTTVLAVLVGVVVTVSPAALLLLDK
ncbi:hypothetical protein [Haloechinothrix salitolerans]|uniref:Uncharacterized protein n=1 Tax=Haloechinothrix salitolerans TaxID=926830 RepID=A0ABW2CAF2_9PSEU